MMKLYWAPGTRSLRTLWMLEEAGAPYERVLVDLRNGGQNDPAFRRINPMGKVPAFEDGAAQLAESAAICAYIAERCPEAGLAPQIGDPLRGRYFHWLFFAPGCIEPTNPCASRIPRCSSDAYCDPRSVWKTQPGKGRRSAIAFSSAFAARRASIPRPTAWPTTRRDQASRISAA